MERRRSPRFHPQIHASGNGAGVTGRRSTRLHPRIESSGDGAGVTCPSSPRLHPQIEASEDGAGANRRIRRRRGASPSPTSLPDDDDMLREILIRLPPQPSSLLRASAVCKRWRGLVTDPRFLRQFYAHHRKPPLLGVFSWTNQGSWQGIVFNPILNPPDCIPPKRFNLGSCSSRDGYHLLDCRHGLVLVRNKSWSQPYVVVCDPITREQHRVAIPPKFKMLWFNGAVLCAASDLGHLHGACHSRPFKVVLVSRNTPAACVYSSDTGRWGNLILTEASCKISGKPAILVGNCLYWLSMGDSIVQLDLSAHRLTVIRGLPITSDILFKNRQIIKADDGAVGYAILSYPRFQMWKMNVNGHGVAMWVPWKTIEMERILKLPPQTEEVMAFLLGYDDDSDAIFLSVSGNVYMVQLKSMQSRKLYESIDTYCYHPFKSFYTPAIREGDEADMLHDP